MPLMTRPGVRRLLGRSVAGRFVAGPTVDDALRAAGELVASGRLVALEHVAEDPGDDEAELGALVSRTADAGLAASCDLTLSVPRLGAARAQALATAAGTAGLGVALEGPADDVAAVAAELPTAVVVVPAREPGAEDRCRALADRRVRLVGGRGAATDLAFVRCLNVLMSGAGSPGVATSDPRLLAIAGERAAWNGR
ncbi:hypothetical protein ACI797_10145, partial [Geodermatophilus sp. SYSU D00691]